MTFEYSLLDHATIFVHLWNVYIYLSLSPVRLSVRHTGGSVKYGWT